VNMPYSSPRALDRTELDVTDDELREPDPCTRGGQGREGAVRVVDDAVSVINYPVRARVDRISVCPARRDDADLYLQTRRKLKAHLPKRSPLLQADDVPVEKSRPHLGGGVGGRGGEHDDVDVGVHPGSVPRPRADDNDAAYVIVVRGPRADLPDDGLDFLSSLLCHHGASLARPGDDATRGPAG
jgi:hypothetical protein